MKHSILILLTAFVLLVSLGFCFYMGYEATYWKEKYELQVEHCENKLNYTNHVWQESYNHCNQMRNFYREMLKDD